MAHWAFERHAVPLERGQERRHLGGRHLKGVPRYAFQGIGARSLLRLEEQSDAAPADLYERVGPDALLQLRTFRPWRTTMGAPSTWL